MLQTTEHMHVDANFRDSPAVFCLHNYYYDVDGDI